MNLSEYNFLNLLHHFPRCLRCVVIVRQTFSQHLVVCQSLHVSLADVLSTYLQLLPQPPSPLLWPPLTFPVLSHWANGLP